MPAPQSAQITWPMMLSMWSAFLPPLAALLARRYRRRDPVGQVAICWLVMAFIGAVGLLRAMRYIPASFPIGYSTTALFPVLLVPPSLTWIGPRARRWRWPIVAAWCTLCAAAIVAFDSAREFRAVMQPLMALGMTTLSGMALASRVNHTDGGVQRADWFWILTAHVVYFASDILRQPLSEALVARHWETVAWVNNGVMLIYVALYVMLSRGMLLRAPVAAPAAGRLDRMPQPV